jgi:divalent metal cation (Fe/Co/Zn/Cd) transporter
LVVSLAFIGAGFVMFIAGFFAGQQSIRTHIVEIDVSDSPLAQGKPNEYLKSETPPWMEQYEREGDK